MANGIIAAPNWLVYQNSEVTPTVFGGNWRRDNPLTNLLNQRFSSRAISVNASPESTFFWVDLGRRREVLVAAIDRCSGSLDASIRIRAYEAADQTSTLLADSGLKPLYPVVYPYGTLPFEHESFWTGKYTKEKAATFNMPWWVVFPTRIVARYWLVEIFDETNPAAQVSLPSVWLAPGWQGSLNMLFGANLQIQDLTIKNTTIGGRDVFDQRKKRRTWLWTYDYLPEDEAFSTVYDLQMEQGTSRPVFAIFDPEDTTHAHRRAFPARMRDLSPIEINQTLTAGTSFALEEQVS